MPNNPTARPLSISKNLGAHLDALRGIAALAVAVGHLRNIMFVDAAQVEQQNLFTQAIYFVTGFGHQAVIIFFVLSGLLISKSVLGNFRRGNWSWKDYLIQRLTRLWIVLIPALFIGLLWDLYGIHRVGTEGIYGGIATYGNVIPAPVLERTDWLTYLGNVFFLQNIKVYTAGSNGALWSLSYEFWYYVLFPILLLSLFFSNTLWKRVSYLIVFCVLAYSLRFTAMPAFPIWLMGTAALLLPEAKILKVTKNYQTLSTALLLLFLSMLSRARMNKEILPFYQPGSDFVMGLSLACFLYVLKQSPITEANKSYANTAKWLASFSYTLYLTHLPIEVFLTSLFTTGARLQPTASNLALGLGLSLLVVFYSYVFSLVTEKQTERVRQWLEKRTQLPHAQVSPLS